MLQPEYNEKLKQIELNYKKAKNDLYIEYGKTQRLYKLGDIICTEYIDKRYVPIGYFPAPIGTSVSYKYHEMKPLIK